MERFEVSLQLTKDAGMGHDPPRLAQEPVELPLHPGDCPADARPLCLQRWRVAGRRPKKCRFELKSYSQDHQHGTRQSDGTRPECVG